MLEIIPGVYRILSLLNEQRFLITGKCYQMCLPELSSLFVFIETGKMTRKSSCFSCCMRLRSSIWLHEWVYWNSSGEGNVAIGFLGKVCYIVPAKSTRIMTKKKIYEFNL